MGLTVLEVEVGNPGNPLVTDKVEFLIDSGAIYSVVPAAILEKSDHGATVSISRRIEDSSQKRNRVIQTLSAE